MPDVLPFPIQGRTKLLQQALRLLKAFASIEDARRRAYIVEFVEGVAAGEEQPAASGEQPGDAETASDEA